MATHAITITTTDAQEAELQLACIDAGGVTVQQLVQAQADALLNVGVRNRRDKRWNSLTDTQKDTALVAGESTL